MINMNRIILAHATLLVCIAFSNVCEGKTFRLHPVDSTAYPIKVALDSIVIPGSRKRNLVVTRKRAPGVTPEFHYEPDTTGLVYVYRRNADDIAFESRPGLVLRKRDNPYAVLRTQYGTIVFDKSIKDWVSVSPNAVSVEMRVGDWRQLDGNICSIRHGHPLPDDYWTRRFTIKDIIY
mgnify:FL=1